MSSDGPLILTPLIKAGQILEAQEAAKVVHPQFGPVKGVQGYSGFFTVRPEFNSNLFFWFFPSSEANPETAPILLWLQGGPGESAMYGLFTEHGPYLLDASLNVTARATAWTKTHSIIYMDSPVGAGFSYTDNVKGYAKNEEDVGHDLYEGLLQFFQMFPQFQKNHFFVGGESYGGKYVPAISWKIHQENRRIESPRPKINLKGLVMGNAFSDPVSTLDYGNLLFDLGLLDTCQKRVFQEEEEKARGLVQAKKFGEAFNIVDKLLFGSKEQSQPTLFEQFTGFKALYNLLRDVDPPEMVEWFTQFVQQDSIRRAIHVGPRPFNHIDLGGLVAHHLNEDICDSVKPWVEELLDADENYKILYFTGQLDICVGVSANNHFIKSLRWKGAQKFDEEAPKTIWRVNGMLAGYSKTWTGLTQVIIRNAGHRVPYDQPEFGLDMINRFTGEGGPNFGSN